MESRYALRELQGAIGRDSRRLEDGRRAVFRHTMLHKVARWNYLERVDSMMVLHASMLSVSSLGARAGLNLSEVVDIIKDSRAAFVKAAYPYLEPAKAGTPDDDMDKLFKELRDINAALRREAAAQTGVSEDRLAEGGANGIIH